ncbi:MAG: monovalent cation/H+ antiporter subunit A [Marinobacter sp.]|uniref:monovalent cation/H+ antiporter subunit A n=1 Tax=Marinobacter sp. TaxID=50741 RepID=UPI0029C20951|nr:monovalent cation/H+ antiporter subunit A [Marinobacter sp.]MDX5385024.1 monovalent cation/H+ antiporter subunit A [Marinobacter sp.]
MAPGLIILLPVLGAFASWLLSRRSAGTSIRAHALLAAVAPFTGVLLLATHWPQASDQNALVTTVQWIPQLGLDLSFRLDGLSWLFATLITGIGCLIILYARYYFDGKATAPRFFILIQLFMTAMLGIVLSENLLFMLVFWELTSLVSFLLIGFNWSSRGARRGARMSLVITGGGGLALLAGILLLGNMAGSFQLSDILSQGEMLKQHSLYPLMLSLVLLGAFTKSAQAPFHLWLPHAMAAPTPVSAYLHSATMVKAGLFLMARLHPALGDTELWFALITVTGMVTLMVGAFVAMFMHDIKGLLAYSTISHLGLITLLIGMGSEMAMAAALFHLVCHALFKAPLFMMAGYVDQTTGSRDMQLINGLWRWMPALMIVTLVPAAAMAGLPLMSGYLSKKMLFSESLLVTAPHWADVVIPAWVTVAGLFSVAYSVRIFHNVFFNGQPRDLPVWPPKRKPAAALLPLAILATLSLLVGLVPQWIYDHLVHLAVLQTTVSHLPAYDFSALSNAHTPAMMSLVAMLGGLAVYSARKPLFAIHARLPEVDAKDIFETAMQRTIRFSQTLVYRLENGSLQRYLALILLTTVALVAWSLSGLERWRGPVPMTALDPLVVFGISILCLSAVGVVLCHRHRLPALLLLSVTGLFVTLTFAWFSAPDLALTQLSVEVMAVVIMMLALSFLPQSSPKESRFPRIARDLFVALAAGGGVAAFTFAVLTRPANSISDFFLANSVPGGGGTNVVNVILVDFRGFDTLGEITVLGIAAVAVFAFTRNLNLKKRVAESGHAHWVAEPHPVILQMVAHMALPIALLVSAYIFLRGHNMPGGGFIAGLVTAVALTLQYMAGGLVWAQARMRTHFRSLIGAGLLIALLTGVASWMFGYPFLTTTFAHLHWPLIGEFELASALLFDLGVYTTVVGATLLILANLGKLMTIAGPGKEVG